MPTTAPGPQTPDLQNVHNELLPEVQLRPRRSTIGLGSGMRRLLRLTPVLALAIGLTAACADQEPPTLPSNLPPIPTALPSGLPTSIPTAIPTKAPDTAQGTPLGFDGALLEPSSLPVETSAGAGAACDEIVDNEWVADDCGAVANYAWVVSRHGEVGEPGTGWQAYLAWYDKDQGSWVKLLSYTDVAGDAVTSITGRSATLTGAGEDVVFAYRSPGTGDILSYDIVGTNSDPTILAHREISHGTATLDGTAILDTEAAYPNGEPNCCPAYFQQSRVSYRDSDGQFVVTPTARLSEPPTGDF